MPPGYDEGVQVIGIKMKRIPLVLVHSEDGDLNAQKLGLPPDVQEIGVLVVHPKTEVRFDAVIVRPNQVIAWIEPGSKFIVRCRNIGDKPIYRPILTGYNPTKEP